MPLFTTYLLLCHAMLLLVMLRHYADARFLIAAMMPAADTTLITPSFSLFLPRLRRRCRCIDDAGALRACRAVRAMLPIKMLLPRAIDEICFCQLKARAAPASDTPPLRCLLLRATRVDAAAMPLQSAVDAV